MSGSNGKMVNSVFYASTYHPIQAGSIDGTDILPHDSAVYRAHLCSSIGLYDPFGDPNVTGDPYCTLFVGRLSHSTTEHTLYKAMSKYGRVKSLRLVRHIVTGASRGCAFVEFETEREMRRAYKDAHHSFIDDCEIIVDYNRQQLMHGWIPRRLGGGLGGKKESGQLRFGGRERPFRAPLRPIPYDELKKLGIPPPPEGRYMSRFQVPSPPRRERTSSDGEEEAYRSSKDREERTHRRDSVDRLERSHKRGHSEKDADFHCLISKDEHRRRGRKYDDGLTEIEEHYNRDSPMDQRDILHGKISVDEEEDCVRKKKSSEYREDHRRRHSNDREDRRRRHYKDREERSHKRDSGSRDERDTKHDKHRSKSQRHEEKRSISNDHSVDY